MKLKNDKLNYFLFGFCLAIAGRAAGSFVNNNADGRAVSVDENKTKTVQQDARVWRDTLFVLASNPSMMRDGADIVFTNRNGIRQMVNNMTDNVTAVDYGDVVVINEECRIIELLERNQKLENFVKQK